MRAELVSIAILALLFAGCTQPTTEPTASTPPKTSSTGTSMSPTGEDAEEDFDNVTAGDVPSGWKKYEGTWAARANDTDTAHPKIMRGEGADPPGLSSLVDEDAGTFGDVEVVVSFKAVEGDAGAGLVTHWKDADNYNIVRYSIRENAWHLFTMIDGNRQKKDVATVAGDSTHPDLNVWVDLRVRSVDGHIEAFDGATKVIAFDLPADASHLGYVGLFSRGDTIVDFDDFGVESV
jgi:hypothetical protein